jgi:hypothetical protein
MRDGTSAPRVGHALISGEDPSTITTREKFSPNFAKLQYAQLLVVHAETYGDASKLIRDFIKDTSYDAWLRPYFCYGKQGGLSKCARRYLKSLGVEPQR